MYQKKTQLEHILLRPDTYTGSVERHEQTLWIWQDNQMVKKPITFVPGLYKIFDEILVNAPDNKQRDPKMDGVKFNIDVAKNTISVWNNGDGIPVEMHQGEGVYVPELIFGHLLTSSNYDDSIKKTTGGRNGYGAKLANIFFTEFTIETADGKRNKRYNQNEYLKKTDGKRKGKLNIPKLEDANLAASANSGDCTLILTDGDSAKALAVESGLSVVGQDYYGVFPLKGKLLNVREASPKQLQENAEIQNIKKILGLQHGKNYENDHDGSHIKGLLINFLHSFWPSLLKVPNFMLEFITPIVKATNKKTKKVLSFYTMSEYEAWKENLGNKATEYKIKYYKGLGTSESKEGAEYFADLDQHMKDFVWADDKDGDAVELAFSKKKIEERKKWLRALQAGTYFDSKEKHIPYHDFINKEFILFSMADLQRSIPSMVDRLKPGQRKILFCAFKKPIIQEIKVAQFSGYVSEHSAYHHAEWAIWYTSDGEIYNLKKHDTPEQIPEDFFHLRLNFYEKRRTALLRELGKASLLLENKVRFIREVVEGTIAGAVDHV
nr:DNA topoisomerase 2 [Tanacetum cinerariifolium]